MQFAITGANGYFGSYLCRRFEECGHNVRRLQRAQNLSEHQECTAFSLEQPTEIDLSGVDVLIHCAYDFSLKRWDDIKRVNATNTKLFFEAAIAQGVAHIVFVSSMSAFEGCLSNYGKAKHDVEKFAISRNIIILKPGLIIGSELGGITKKLHTLCKVLPILPYPYSPTAKLAIADRNTLFELIDENLKPRPKNSVLERVNFVSDIGLADALAVICKKTNTKKPIFIPVPSICFLVFLHIIQWFYPKIRIGPDNLISFLSLR